MKYERLTKRNKDGSAIPIKSPKSDYIATVQEEWEVLRQEIYNRLAELEDKIENGTFIELPCKDLGAFPCEMGATVWLIYKRYWNVADENGFWVLRKSKVSPHNKKRCSDDFGKFVFLTKAEAEAKLKELLGE